MPIRIVCPNGHELFAEPEHLGRKVRCPACKTVLVATDPNAAVAVAVPVLAAAAPLPPPAATPPPLPPAAVSGPPPLPSAVAPGLPPVMPASALDPREEPAVEAILDELEPLNDDDDFGPRRRKMKNKERLRRANLGLGFHYAKMLCILFSLFMMMVSLFVLPMMAVGAAASAASRDSGGVMAAGGLAGFVIVVTIVSFLVALATPVLGCVGSVFCFWLPKKTKARGLIIASFSLDAAAIVCGLLGVLVSLAAVFASSGNTRMEIGNLALFLYIFAVLASYAGWVLFMIALRNLAYFLKDEVTGDQAIRLMMFEFIVGCVGPVFDFFIVLTLRGAPGFAAVVMFIIILAWLASLFKITFDILNLISTIRQNILTRW